MAIKGEARCPVKCGLVHVTTALQSLSKPALLPWAVKQERLKIREAALNVLTNPDAKQLSPDDIWKAIESATEGVSEAERIRKEAAEIGTTIHALIEAYLLNTLGKPGNPDVIALMVVDPPQVAIDAFNQFLIWSDSVDLRPLEIECHVQHDHYGYAGKFDLYGTVNGVPTIIDFKSSKAIWPESWLQLVAYREAALSMGMVAEQALIVRIPKVVDDPGIEAVLVPEEATIEHFLACLEMYKFQKLSKTTMAMPLSII
jgi:hypothetical protein